MRLFIRPGFTLIELVIAAFIFAVGVLALEATAAVSLRRMQRSATLSTAATVARSRVERLAATRCDAITGGTDTVRSIVSSWSVQPSSHESLRLVSQTLTYSVDGSVRTDSYRTLVACLQ